MNNNHPALLLQVNRGNIVEREHYGYVVAVNAQEDIIFQAGGDIKTPFFLRSCGKPFQALPIITSGTYHKFDFSLEELAITTASHTGSHRHIELIKNILKKIGLTERDLKCGIHDPIDVESKNLLIKQGLELSPIYNNCSGKHAGMLAVCKKMGWDTENYLDFDHPLQKEIRNIIKKYCNIKTSMENSIDGCSAPVYAMPLYKIGAGYLRLFSSSEAVLIKKAFAKNPYLIGGNNRLDSIIIEATKGRLIAKVGAEGLCTVINLEKMESLVVKLIDSNMAARSIVTIESLKQLKWLNQHEVDSNEIRDVFNTKIKTLTNIEVGEIKPVFKI